MKVPDILDSTKPVLYEAGYEEWPYANDTNRSAAIDGCATRHAGYQTSQTIRKRIEECFGWLKIIGGLRKSRFVGRDKLDFRFVLRAPPTTWFGCATWGWRHVDIRMPRG